MQGKLELIIGNMFSGKSTELIRRINTTKSINKNILVINYSLDNRYSSQNEISTHDLQKMKCLKVSFIKDSFDLVNDYDSIFIDEGQFFPDLYDSVIMLVEKFNKHVIVSGLDGDSNRSVFGDMIRLIPMCDTVDKLRAYCNKCNDGTYGPFTKKISGSPSELLDIGGSDKYIPVCRKHFN
uniref:thymidine kinase n=1 Tax=viral metagenome TaxID=1070528 RepID=A0A6C0I8Q8_9ZZZZ